MLILPKKEPVKDNNYIKLYFCKHITSFYHVKLSKI